MKIVLLEPKYHKDLERLLKEFAKDVWEHDEGTVDTDLFISSHWCIYLAIANDGEVIGFSSYILNHYFGLRPSTVANTYVFVTSKHRRGKAMYLFALQSGRVSADVNLPLEHYYGSEMSMKLSSKLKGEKIYEAYVYPVEEVAKTFGRLKNKVRIK